VLSAGNPTGGLTKNLPPVTNHMEEKYYTRPEDQAFEQISQKIYGSPKYARPLLEYNRRHVLAKATLMENPPRLEPNQVVYYPDRNILEIQYAALLGAAAPGPSSPVPAVKMSGPNPLTAPSVAPPTADRTVDYTVSAPQYVFDIAQKTLGDGHKWVEILRLNPSLHTEQPIPAGTLIRLPEGAKLR
jgi:hypothetical protein